MELSIQNDLKKYVTMLDNIQNNFVKKIYSKFSFQYYNFLYETEMINKNNEKVLHKTNKILLLNILRNFKFITYNIYNPFFVCSEPNNKYTKKDNFINNTNSISDKVNVVFCVENNCIIIEHFEVALFQKIITKLKDNKVSIINTSPKSMDSEENPEENQINNEIFEFCKVIQFEIKNNVFIQNTISSIAGYLIRRYFYPTEYFTNPSFFDFDRSIITNERFLKSEIIELLDSKNTDIKNYTQIKEKTIRRKNFIEFKENEFIKLRAISSSDKSTFFLVFHIESFYLFTMKKLNHPDISTREIKNEIYFCENFSHRCLTHFYGFLKNNGEIIGFIYEFMSNGSLKSYASSNRFLDKNNKVYHLMIINRILQGIEYLHSNKLIHRDLKPSNILIDHDFLPYISDFETIRHPKDEIDFISAQKMSINIGSLLYSSPEQYQGGNVSYPTDIYSFGLIVYFTIENKNFYEGNNTIDYLSDDDEIQFTNKFSKNIQEIFKRCLKMKPEDRILTCEIKSLLLIEIYEFLILLFEEKQINQFIYELIIIQNNINELFISFITSYLHSLKNKDGKSKFYYIIGSMYANGIGVEKNMLKAIKNYEMSAELNNTEAINNLGKMYENGNGVEKNYSKAKEYYEKSVSLNNSEGLNNLAYLYYHGLGVKQNYTKSIELYELSAEQNNPEALDNLGYIYKNGIGVDNDYAKAKNYYELAAKQNNSYALNNLGNLYKDGLGVEKNYVKAKEYYELAIKQNNKFAFHNLGSLYENGLGVEQNYLKAIEYYELSAKQNNTKSLNRLGYFYLKGIFVEQDYSKAKEYFELSAKRNNSYAFINLGNFYANGLGVEKNFNKAKEYYELSINQNNSDALISLGNLYANKFGVDHDYSKAKEYYESAINKNNSDGYVNLGNLYANGHGVKQDYSKAKEFYELAVKMNNNSKALNSLGVLYEKGLYVEQNYYKALEYYTKAAKQNNSDAFNNLGYLYENGFAVFKSYSKAREFYELSANLNNSDAFINLGILYLNGLGVNQNYYKAMEYFVLSAKQNNSDALINLGFMYKNGYGVKQDYSKAINYFELSGKQNNPRGFNNLGYLYFNGIGVKQDYSKAIEYYELSAKLNNSTALNNLGYMYLNGLGVDQNYSKAKEFFELATKQNNQQSYLNLGDIYYYGYGVTKDFLQAKNFYEMSAKSDNSEAFYKIGNLYFKGEGVDKNYLKAIEYFERAAAKLHSESLDKLGDIYYNGYGVNQNYVKAKEYYDKSALLGNSNAILKVGKIYYQGKGVEQNFLKAEEYFELSCHYNNPDAYFYLGDLYSNCNNNKYNASKAVQYFLKSIEIHYDKKIVYNSVNRSGIIKNIYNNYFYHSYNDLGLIYIIVFEDINKGFEYIKKSAFGEYPFGQNNFGLINEIYYNDISYAKYMFKKSSKQNFALAEFNLGRLKEKKGKIEKSIKKYKKASDNEDKPLIFHDHEHNDVQLEISKKLIICLTNLKLTEYYFLHSNYDESKKYFVRAFLKFKTDTENNESRFIIKIKKKQNPKCLFCYFKNLILNYSLFNLVNQPNLKLNIKKNLISLKKSNEIARKYCFVNNKSNDSHEFINKKIIDDFNNNENKKSTYVIEEEILLEDFGGIFNLIISNKEYKNSFAEEIKEIIQIMEEIIYTPPYQILFGKINIEIPKENRSQIEINELFYDGFGPTLLYGID